MKLWASVLLATAALAGVVCYTALSSASGAPTATLLSRAARGSGAPVRPARLACSVAEGGAGSSVRLRGACSGVLGGTFACVNEGEVQAVSIHRPLPGGRGFYLTVVVPEFEGPGTYSDDVVSAQIVDAGDGPRWANIDYGIPIVATRDKTFELGSATLLPEPGTPATGVITLAGTARCG